MSDKRRLATQVGDPLANVIKHPEGLPYHSLISGLSGIIYGSYRELITAEEIWGKQFKPKKTVPTKKKRPVDDGLDLTPAELL